MSVNRLVVVQDNKYENLTESSFYILQPEILAVIHVVEIEYANRWFIFFVKIK